LADEIEALDLNPTATLAFLASGIEGLKIRITAKAATRDEAVAQVSAEEDELRTRLGDLIFGVDDETMEYAVAQLLLASGQTLAVAESVTGGLIGARLTNTSGISKVFRGGVISYQSQVKFDLLDVPEGPVVTPQTAQAMAVGVRRLLDADIGLATTGVAGPDPQDNMPPGVVFVGLAFGDETDAAEVRELRLPGDRHLVRQYAVISALDLLRHRLLAAQRGTAPEDPPSIFWMGKPSPSS
jgi:nicotinamide-nucleotide amidase